MQDLDGFFGWMAFGANTGEKIFSEYVPDSWDHRWNYFREFALVGLFDRKTTAQYAFSDDNRVSTAHYLWICRSLSKLQPIAAKFFFVIGQHAAPWEMIELNINTGDEIKRYVLYDANWKEIWNACGLKQIRDDLMKWIRTK